MSAPKFIYLQWAGKEFESTWCIDAVGEDDIPDIKYVRADEHARELPAKDAEIAVLRKDAERWKEVVCRIRTGAIHNGQKVNDKLINGHRDRNRILFSLIGEADPYDPGDKDGFQKVIDAAIAAKQ